LQVIALTEELLTTAKESGSAQNDAGLSAPNHLAGEQSEVHESLVFFSIASSNAEYFLLLAADMLVCSFALLLLNVGHVIFESVSLNILGLLVGTG
jgi:hypothetical protein